MKNIDFLPARYRERRSTRNSHLWRLVVLAAFGAAVGATAVGQQLLKNSAAAQVAAVDAQLPLATAKNGQFSTLQRQLAEARASAQLYAYLQHPWPRTRIMALLAEPLPDEVTLTEVSIARESLDDAQRETSGRPRRRRETDEDDARLTPAERDLQQLRDEFDKRRSIVRITGRTTSIASLHEYVAGLAASPLVAKAELSSLETARADNAGDGSEFHLRVLIVAAHGQSDGLKETADLAARGGDQ
jgi:Tfp pilus assembly protein PilN